ncbi:hypothetical protein [Desulfuribacillus alkaliarsenatis]|uniref:Uncharacterized protein n=1 Tax=Desulfuribacillus alkaliarsenatis TaxID=766136 RepID=A0A1E5G559_9FIRM|nr:hypothetical protein [Desulfuribacillus alkaliarsenatis]OEF98306.1 hypothetical protein BHF68_01095 [Desulfuribacillus alkaliarsenatis]
MTNEKKILLIILLLMVAVNMLGCEQLENMLKTIEEREDIEQNGDKPKKAAEDDETEDDEEETEDEEATDEEADGVEEAQEQKPAGS